MTLLWIFLHFGNRIVLLNQILLLWIWREYVISKRRIELIMQHGFRVQRTIIWGTPTVKTWKLSRWIDNKNTKFKTSYFISKLATVICIFSETWSLHFCALYYRNTLLCICLENRCIQKKGGSVLVWWIPVLCVFVKWIFEEKDE